jgi:hypothetical protein
MGYVGEKNDIEEKVKYFEDIDILKLGEEKQEELLKKLNSIFYKCIELKIEKAEEKKQIENLIYEMRYYKILSETKNAKTEEKLIEKACSQKVIVTFSSNEKLNYNITKKILETRIIDLDTVAMMLKYNKGILKIRMYDGKIEDETSEIKITEKVELNVKLNKKIKVWE